MAFGDFQTTEAVARAYAIAIQVGGFVQPLPLAVSEALQTRLRFVQEHARVKMSEAAICEFLIAPVLQEIWVAYSDILTIWSHVPLGTTEPLLGVPDYFFCKRSSLGLVPDQPYVIVMEAKKDDFEAGWGQCLAAMLAAQQLNQSSAPIVYGCVSNGLTWQFGQLAGQQFTQEICQYVISDLPELFAAWNYIFMQAREQALAAAA